jgi:hypothetical protein
MPFKDGTGRIWDIAVFIVEALGHVNPAKVKRQGGAQAAAVREQEMVEASLYNHFRHNRDVLKSLTLQGAFDQEVQQLADEIVKIAQREKWLVVDYKRRLLTPPRFDGYVKVKQVHDWYVSNDVMGYNEMAEALKGALPGLLAADATMTPKSIALIAPVQKAEWWLKPKVLRDDGLSGAVHIALRAAHDARRPKPTAREVLAYFSQHKLPSIMHVYPDRVEYAGSIDEETADLKLISRRIEELTTQRRKPR